MKKPEEKIYPFLYDYWVDKEDKKVYAVVEYDEDEIKEDDTKVKVDYKHSNLYLVSTEYHGN